jgi:iron complex outermembrane receptor protein
MYRTKLLAGATALALASTVVPASAQEGNDGLEEIVVTATKFSTNLMDTPIAVSAFSEEELDRLNISNVKDLNNLVPNMSIMVDVESNAPIITLRGVRSTNTTEWGDPAVGVHYDGIYSPRPQGALALMFDIERVEVLRGPQGTLFGRNSTVGTANIISRTPI